MKDLKHTKGEWELRISGYKDYIAIDTNGIAETSNRSIIYKPFDPQSKHFNEDYYNEWVANAKLIADAGTTTNKCGLLPSELLEQRNELLEALDRIPDLINLGCYGDAAKLALKAIKKATE